MSKLNWKFRLMANKMEHWFIEQVQTRWWGTGVRTNMVICKTQVPGSFKWITYIQTTKEATSTTLSFKEILERVTRQTLFKTTTKRVQAGQREEYFLIIYNYITAKQFLKYINRHFSWEKINNGVNYVSGMKISK